VQRGVGVAAPDALDERADHVVVLVPAAVVADGRAVHGPLQRRGVDLAAGRHAQRGRLQIGQRPPGVTAGQPDQVLQRLVLQRDRPVQGPAGR